MDKKTVCGLKIITAALAMCAAAGVFVQSGAKLDVKAETAAYDDGMSGEYISRLDEIAVRQAQLRQQLEGADNTILSESERQAVILEEISAINEKTEVLNAYMTELEMRISSQQRELKTLKDSIDSGLDIYKKHLRAKYLQGELSYADVVLGSGSFYDVLMRAELWERATKRDVSALDELVAKKSEYDSRSSLLQNEENIYDEQIKSLEREKKQLADLYNSSSETKQLLREQMDAITNQERVFENEIYSYEGILSDLLKGTYSSDADEAARLETESQAQAALEQLYARIAAGDTVSDLGCTYQFMWPVKQHHYVSSGVGARWGTYHTGLDIPGEGGFPICAAEAGEVVRTNNSCTHNYGKDGSCGCGGGFGNFVIIDHGNGFLTLYGHMTTTQVEVGDKVSAGQQIGLMGSTGYSTGTHLHFEIRYGGYVTDPSHFISRGLTD